MASSGSRDRRWATVSGSARSGAPRSGLAASSHSVMARKRNERCWRIWLVEVLCFNATVPHSAVV